VAGERRMNAASRYDRTCRASNMNSKPWWTAASSAAAISLSAYGIGDALRQYVISADARRAVSSGCPAPLRVSASLVRPYRSALIGAERNESGVRLRSRFRFGTIAADVPDALTDTTGTFDRQPHFLRRGHGIGKSLWDSRENHFPAPRPVVRALFM